MRRHDLRLCLITHPDALTRDPEHQLIKQCIQGGVTCVQLRLKNQTYATVRQAALELLDILRPCGIPLIINDDVHLAKEINADGVHVGQSDHAVAFARDVLGPDKIIGLSIENLAQLHQANACTHLDYLAASAIFPSTTKTNCVTFWGLHGLQHIKQNTPHPVIAIGGINEQNIGAIKRHGADGIALISALYDSPDPYASTQSFIKVMDAQKNR